MTTHIISKREGSNSNKWGSKLVNSREGLVASGVEILTLASIVNFGVPEATSSLKEAGYFIGHSTNTVLDALQGGPKGERAAKNLEEAITIVENAASVNKEAAGALSAYFSSRKDFAATITNIYQENENLVRVATRLEVQLKGVLKNLFEVGNNLKPQIMRDIDSVVVQIYGMNPVEALEKSENLRQFYGQVRKFYDSREQNEQTIKTFCDYLVQVKTATTEKNKEIEQAFPKLISRLREGYGLENYVFELDGKGADITKNEVLGTHQKVGNYKTNVDTTKTEIGYITPVNDNSGNVTVDMITNPFVMAAAGVLLWKGLSKIIPYGKPIDKALSKVVTYPVKLAGDIVNDVYEKIVMNSANKQKSV